MSSVVDKNNVKLTTNDVGHVSTPLLTFTFGEDSLKSHPALRP